MIGERKAPDKIFTFRIVEDGTLDPRGWDFSGKFTVLYTGEACMVLRKSTGKMWNGRGDPMKTEPAAYILAERIATDGNTIKVRVLRWVEPGNKWKQAKSRLIELCKDADNATPI